MNPPYRPYTQGKLDMVPSSLEDASRATRGQPKRPNYLGGEMARTLLYCCALSRLFVHPGLRLFVLVWLFIIWLFIRFQGV